MSTTLPKLPAHQVSPTSRTSSVVMGQPNYLAVLLRLVTMELYKIRRRALSKVLATISIGLIIIVFSSIAIYTGIQASRPLADFSPILCSQVPKTSNPNCLDHQPTQAELTQHKQFSIQGNANLLSLPGSLDIIVLVINNSTLALIIIILAGSLVGGEYSFGTIRLLFTRGPTRIQFLLAQVIAIGICTLIGLLTMTLIGILLGYLFYPLFGIAFNFSFFTATWLGHSLLMFLISMLGWFTYALIAIFIGTLGRSTVAGIVSGVMWLFMELILSNIIGFIAGSIGGSVGTFLAAIPTYFISNNINSLVQNQRHYIHMSTPTSALSDLHSLLVLAGYLLVFIALSCWLTIQRDVTH